jgi:hypothetical protein
MNFALTPFVAGWVVLVCVVASLAIYRRTISTREDDMLHVADGESGRISKQAEIAHRLDMVDRWGKLVTLVVTLYGLLLAAAYTYQIWTEGSRHMWKG